MSTEKNENKNNLSSEEQLRLACERFAKKLKVSDQKLTYDGNGKITACRWS